MAIPTYDFTVKQGNSGTLDHPTGLVVSLVTDEGAPRDLSAAEVVFFAQWNGATQLRLSSDAGDVLLDAPEGKVTVPFSVSSFESASSRKNIRYELEVREGEAQRTVLEGKISVLEGINDD
ncbi:MAG: hypothetical protein AAGF13_03635 [Pseudomonadota bacterium]